MLLVEQVETQFVDKSRRKRRRTSKIQQNPESKILIQNVSGSSSLPGSFFLEKIFCFSKPRQRSCNRIDLAKTKTVQSRLFSADTRAKRF